ncbi:hypothetical protein FRB93_012189 [Tulasnella sp. JGI-2019a]|nr:hypothetical protein FRB93_012189 [Tulasnella sp. JGI-2019a]
MGSAPNAHGPTLTQAPPPASSVGQTGNTTTTTGPPPPPPPAGPPPPPPPVGPAHMNRRRRRMIFQGEFVPGPGRSTFSSLRYTRRLGEHPLDLSVLTVGPEAERVNQTRALLPPQFNTAKYAEHWHILIHVEEDQTISDLAMYNLQSVTLRPQGRLFFCEGSLEVLGLAEKRPSVLVEDIVHVRLCNLPDKFYGGRVREVRQQEVGLAFRGSFVYAARDRCDVEFTLNRIPIRRMHGALNVAFNEERTLFPEQEHVLNVAPTQLQMNSVTGTLFNPLIATNHPQLEAVTAILNRTPSSVPFVVFGPPGTGKTVTIIEAILQLVKKRPDIKILACAPSNYAADLIARKLSIHLGPEKLFRLNAPFREVRSMSEDLRPFCCFDNFGRFSVDGKEGLVKYNVVVSTCMSASIPWGIKVPAGHFAYIFIDEAGQATEPEAMVSIKMMSDARTNVVLSGDPLQLRPIVRSGVARRLGLEVSYLERLMDLKHYRENIWRGRTFTKLVKNFRSHGDILGFPNDQFYENELEVCGGPEVIDRFLSSAVLPNPGLMFPVVFHGVAGTDDREPNSPSYFNIAEIDVVTKYVERLLADSGTPITPSEIGVIAPYRAQSSKIRTRFKALGHLNLKVGSVEEYQGQERDVIILTTVRTDHELEAVDLRHNLGFMVDPRRLNVAITRAKGLLIIVGDPHILGRNPLWKQLLNYVHTNGGWTGREPNWDPNAETGEDSDE